MKFILSPTETIAGYRAIVRSEEPVKKGDAIEYQNRIYSVESVDEEGPEDWYHLLLGEMPTTDLSEMFPETELDAQLLDFINDWDEGSPRDETPHDGV